MAAKLDKMGKKKSVTKLIQVSDLVLIWDAQREKQHARTLDPRWLGPRQVVKINQSRTVADVKELYSENVKRYYYNHIRLYLRRDDIIDTTLGTDLHTLISAPQIQTERIAMAYAGFPGQTAFEINQY
jgi:hypothetical protein